MNQRIRLPHALTGIAPGPWFQLLAQAGSIEPDRLADVAKISLRSLQGVPLALREARLCAAPLAEHRVDPRPLFILGHFRSGTTLLHDLLAHDPGFVYPTTFQVFFPRLFVTAKEQLLPAFERSLPPHRYGDHVPLAVHGPHEDEFALGQLSLLGFYHALYFPKRARELFTRSVFLDAEPDRALWQRLYARFLAKVSFEGGGRPLLVKNPAHTGRVPLLLRQFPEARFIHIHRNPFAVYLSSLHFFRRFIDTYAFQRISDAELEELVLYVYQRLMTRLFDDLACIPKGQVAHVCYEELVADPASSVERSYGALGLDLPEALRAAAQKTACAQSTFKTNSHVLDAGSRELVRERWGFALERLGYDPAAPHSSGPARR
ncbi:MAG TPA: sulfotransferase [Polyangiaceae bacterium]|nr:sulfotransferase [Polyangiaceae bacterium]